MPHETIFLACNYGVLPAWLLLIVLPRWKLTQSIVHAGALPVVFGALYVLALGTADTPEGGGFGSLSEVMLLFTSPGATLGGWIHYIVFDLFVGAWIVRDAQRNEIRHAFVIPCLVLTLMVGPSGLLAYVILRFALRRRWTLVETTRA